MSVKYAEADKQEHEAAIAGLPELSMRLLQFADDYPGTVAWLQIPDTSVDYPVMLGTDNQFYLNHLPDGSKNALGSLFLDYRTNEDSAHLIVYGHNGSSGKMFGLLKQYESQEYFSEHQTLTLATSDSLYICPIFSVRRVEADSDAYRMEFEDNDSLISYVNQAASESLYQIDIDLRNAAKVITLSTCAGWRNQRFIVQAVLQAAREGGRAVSTRMTLPSVGANNPVPSRRIEREGVRRVDTALPSGLPDLHSFTPNLTFLTKISRKNTRMHRDLYSIQALQSKQRMLK